jgi:hypothetical protein
MSDPTIGRCPPAFRSSRSCLDTRRTDAPHWESFLPRSQVSGRSVASRTMWGIVAAMSVAIVLVGFVSWHTGANPQAASNDTRLAVEVISTAAPTAQARPKGLAQNFPRP